jgi:hypothetical protein
MKGGSEEQFALVGCPDGLVNQDSGERGNAVSIQTDTG